MCRKEQEPKGRIGKKVRTLHLHLLKRHWSLPSHQDKTFPTAIKRGKERLKQGATKANSVIGSSLAFLCFIPPPPPKKEQTSKYAYKKENPIKAKRWKTEQTLRIWNWFKLNSAWKMLRSSSISDVFQVVCTVWITLRWKWELCIVSNLFQSS